MKIVCQFTAQLPQTREGTVSIRVDSISTARGLTDALREIYLVQNIYPFNKPKLAILCDGQEVMQAEIVEGPREHKNQRPELFLRTDKKTWKARDWIDEFERTQKVA